MRSANLKPLVLAQQRPGLDPVVIEVRVVALFIQALESLADKDFSKRGDILYRIDAVMMQGEFHAMKRGAPWMCPRSNCCGDTTVDFLGMAIRGDLSSFREWIISGLCMRCQDRVFGRGARAYERLEV